MPFARIRSHHLRELIDFLFARKEGENVAGIVAPRGEVRRRVIFSGHFDSAFEFKLWYWFKNFSIPIMIAAVFAFLLLFGASLARAIQNSRGFPGGGAYTVLGIACIALLPLVALFLVFHTRDLVPGAMDDLAGRTRKPNVVRARELVATLGVERYGLRVAEVAKVLHKSVEGISRCVSRGIDRRQSDREFRKRLERLDEELAEWSPARERS